MPTQFTGNVDTPTNLQFGADEYVDSSNSLAGLEEGAKALSAVTGSLVARSLQSDILSEAANEESRYEEIRRTKRALYDAADNMEEEQVAKFTRQLEELTIAENQGAISGNNAGIRKETLLRQYINRFPHREEEIRQLYSTTRRQIAESRASKVSDPIEEGIDEVITEAHKRGTSPLAVLERRRHEDFMSRAALDAQYNAALGVEIAPQIEQAFQEHALPIFYDDATGYLQAAWRKAQETGSDIDATNIKRALEMLKQKALMRVAGLINNIVAVSGEPGATLPTELRNNLRNQVAQIYDGMIAMADNADSLKAYARGLEHQKNKTISELREVDPMIRIGIDIGAPEAMFKYLAEDYPRVAAVSLTQGAAGLQAMMENAPNEMERNRLRFQLEMLGKGYTGEQRAADLKGMLENGTPPESTGDPYVDAIRTDALAGSVMTSKEMPQQFKDNAGIAILEKEKGDSSYLSPGRHWYTNPVRLHQLRSSEVLKTRMRNELTSSAATLTRSLGEDPDLANSLVFQPDPDLDQRNHKEPWKAYKSGGPFSSTTATRLEDEAALAEKMGLPSLAASKRSWGPIIDALNNQYWIIRAIDGVQKAEEWANMIMGDVDAVLQEEAERKQQEATEGFDLPNQPDIPNLWEGIEEVEITEDDL